MSEQLYLDFGDTKEIYTVAQIKNLGLARSAENC